MKITTFDAFNRITPLQIERVTNFLYQHLDEYGDSKSAITKAINYAAKERTGLGGYVFTAEKDNTIVASVVINKTGMDEYIPENILVYVATHKDYRGQGLGKTIIKHAIQNTNGDIALHVEKDNPAQHLYKKLGFTTPYLEMRLKKDNI
ncbi:GNAT family N-acetyltransferase [Tenacibaculum geojense]|uniref:GNAT family N-acetyltransferase n=1 Tax=Tenacibaculum geojense TaxID=915352 RepID=A0ABW3JRZ0_9FLAO